MASTGLVERLQNGGSIVIAEGYLWELERRGYLQSGSHIPEVVLDHPEVVKSLTEEFVHAGSDVCEAFTYYAHREKLRFIDREDDVESMNRTALRIARDVARGNGKLFAGGLCNSCIYKPNDEAIQKEVEAMFKEQVEWAADEGVDYMIGETFKEYGEAKLALEAIQKYGKGVPAVITFSVYIPDYTLDDIPIPEACRMLEEAGAAVVGLNCARGPRSMLPLMREIRKVCKGPIAALPVCFRTNDDCRTFQSLTDPETGKNIYPSNLSCMTCTREDMREFAKEAKEIGVNYIGLCCGNSSFLLREIAEVYGRQPPASKYSPNVSMNYVFGETDKTAKYDVSKLRSYMLDNKLKNMAIEKK